MNRIVTLLLLLYGIAAAARAQPSFPENGELFVDTVVPSVYITINPDTLAWIYANPESNREFRATFVFDNGNVRDTIYPVGFRLRGNTSRYALKKSFKVSFNAFTQGGQYYGVEKMNLNGEHNDPSVMRSKIMWDILRRFGIAAPRANHVMVFINGNYHGVYVNVEHIDEEFALSRFGSKRGNLYKCLYPADLAYRGPDPDSYKLWDGTRWTYELKTNKQENDFSDLAGFIGVLHNSSVDRLLCDLDRVFNVWDYLRVMAVQIFCGDWDGYIYNKNNYYLYHNPLTGKFEYIPYDVDNTFGIDWMGIDWATRNIYAWHPGGDQQRPLYQRIINTPELRDRFTFYASELIGWVIDLDSLMLAVQARKAMISPHVASDPWYPLDYGYTHDHFLNSFTMAAGAHVKQGIFPFLEARKASMESQLEPVSPAPVIRYITHRRTAGEPVHLSAFVEAAALPVDVTLLFSVAGGPQLQEIMTGDGNGLFTASLDGLDESAELRYRVMAADAEGRTALMPCDPVVIDPVAGIVPRLFINEFMAENKKTIADENGKYSDWVEIWNGDTADVFLGGLFLTDSFREPLMWQMPQETLKAGEFLLIWADGNPAAGSNHAPFKLSKGGEEIGIYTSGGQVVDTITFGPQQEDVSMGRRSDGSPEIIFLPAATPGRSNTITSSGRVTGEEELRAWPNPAPRGAIRMSRSGDWSLINSSGIVVHRERDTDIIDTGRLPAGVYILAGDRGEYLRVVIL